MRLPYQNTALISYFTQATSLNLTVVTTLQESNLVTSSMHTVLNVPAISTALHPYPHKSGAIFSQT
jgi:hypothetical protein